MVSSVIINPLEPSQLMIPPRDHQLNVFVLDSYVKNYLLLSIFNIGGIFLVKEYLVAVSIADMKVIILAVNICLFHKQYLNRTRKREFEDVFKINVARTLSSNFCHRKDIILNSAGGPWGGTTISWLGSKGLSIARHHQE